MNIKIIRYIDRFIGIPLLFISHWINKLFIIKHDFSVDGEKYKKILFIKFIGIGNVAMLLPAVHAFKDKNKDSELDFLTLNNCADAAKAAKIFDNIYTVDDKNLIKFVTTFLRNWRRLGKRGYDLIIDFEQFARFSAFFCLLINRKEIVGFNTKWQYRHLAYDIAVPYNNNIHMTRSFFSLAEAVGVNNVSYIKPIPFICDNIDIQNSENILREKGISVNDVVVLLHLGTSENFTERRWPVENYAKLADRLIDLFNVKIIFTGVKSETSYIKMAQRCMKNKGTVDLSGILSFGQYVSMIKLSDLVISADTATVHLASCLSIPVAGLYGPNTPVLYGPWGKRSIWFHKKLECSPCITNYNAKMNKCRHPDGRGACMKKITIDEVFSEIRRSYFDDNAVFKIDKLHG